jgi:FkbM family methyltransferase
MSDFVETPYGRLYIDPEELQIGRFLQENGEIPDISREMALFGEFLRPGDTAIDVGANFGLFSLAFSQIVGNTGIVAAIEPNPAIFDFLEHAVEDYPIFFLPIAVGRRQGLGTLRLDPRGSGGTQVTKDDDGEMVPIRTLDHVRKYELAWNPVRAIKIDTEGMDVDVLRGATKILKEDRPFVIFEWNPEAMRTLGKRPMQELTELIWLCAEANYTLEDLDGNNPPERLAGNLVLRPL